MNWENSFLSWFAEQRIPMLERDVRLGGLQYYFFSTQFDGAGNRKLSGFGCSPDRRTAAIKCAAESIERKIMAEFFHITGPETRACPIHLTPGNIEIQEDRDVRTPEIELRTSNGWAVHSTAHQAKESACLEALERHLLIKSFYRWGWQGFQLIQETQSDDMQIFFMTSRLTSAGHVAGIVATKSPHYPGVSFGYCAGREESIQEASFWQAALFESVTRILILKGLPPPVQQGPNAWISASVKEYLEGPFDLNLFKEGLGHSSEDDGTKIGFLKSFDLARDWGLGFPLFASFCWGGDLIPLCDPSRLDGEAMNCFRTILEKNGLPTNLSMRHPIQ